MPVTLPCGRCIGCRFDKTRQWAVRCLHEASMHEENSFITLTYSDDKLPSDHSLKVEDFQGFLKRLRERIAPKRIKFRHCGEYGSQTNRPHYHSLIFGHDFPDKTPWKKVRGHQYYVSPTLSELWPQGWSTIGNLTFESAAYVARYILKKRTGPDQQLWYEKIDPETGECFQLKPEYQTGSNGIGKGWFQKYKAVAFPHDFIVVNGVKMRPPKYYKTLLETEHQFAARLVTAKRTQFAKEKTATLTPEEMYAKEYIQRQKASNLTREYEK